MKRLLNQLTPFLLIGIATVAFVFGLMLLAYLFLFGAIVGFILFLINWIRHTFFTPKSKTPTKKSHGRIIDSDDWKKL